VASQTHHIHRESDGQSPVSWERTTVCGSELYRRCCRRCKCERNSPALLRPFRRPFRCCSDCRPSPRHKQPRCTCTQTAQEKGEVSHQETGCRLFRKPLCPAPSRQCSGQRTALQLYTPRTVASDMRAAACRGPLPAPHNFASNEHCRFFAIFTTTRSSDAVKTLPHERRP
jgi:hypothetical protein